MNNGMEDMTLVRDMLVDFRTECRQRFDQLDQRLRDLEQQDAADQGRRHNSDKHIGRYWGIVSGILSGTGVGVLLQLLNM